MNRMYALCALLLCSCSPRAVMPREEPHIHPALAVHPYRYQYLTDKEKKLYDTLVSSMLYHNDSVVLTGGFTYDEVNRVYQLIYTDEYRLFCISPQFGCNTDSDTVSEVFFSYTCPADEQAVMQKRLDAAVSEILDAAKGRSDRDTVRIIHDQIIRRCTYSNGSYENSAYGCLVEGQALCQGYTAAFEYLCSRAGIQTAPVETADGSHIWALVLLDGDYYHVDVTWDDPDDIDRPLYTKYDYLFTNDADMADRDISPEAPAADGENDYFRANSLVAEDIGEAQRIIQTAVPDDGGAIQFRAADKESFDSIMHELFDNRALAGIFPQKDIYYTYDRETLVIHIFP